MGFFRDAAIIGHHDQERVDVAILILLHKEHITEEISMSAFQMHVQWRHQAGSVNAYFIRAEDKTFSPVGRFRRCITLRDTEPCQWWLN